MISFKSLIYLPHQIDMLVQIRPSVNCLAQARLRNVLKVLSLADDIVSCTHLLNGHPEADNAPKSRGRPPSPDRSFPTDRPHCDRGNSPFEYLDLARLLL